MTAPSNPPRPVVSQGLHIICHVDPNCIYSIATANPTTAPITVDHIVFLARLVIRPHLAV